jgi:glutaredoxin 3
MTATVEIFTKFACPFCYRAKALLDSKGATYTELDAMGATAWNQMVERSNGRRTVPQIFINGHHVGGCDELMALEGAGKLDPMLAGQSAG